MMDAASYDQLLTGPLSARLTWEASHRCGCVQPDGAGDRACPVCSGKGRYWDPPTAPFRAGLVGLTAKALEALRQTMGPGTTGDAILSVPVSAPCHALLRSGDRLLALDALDALEWVVMPASPVLLPAGAAVQTAKVRSPTGMVAVPIPGLDARGRVAVAVPTVLAFQAPRRFEVVGDAGQVRAFGPGLPRKVLLKLIDWTQR